MSTISYPRQGSPSGAVYGSDLVVDVLRHLQIPYVCLNPGSSFRGFHDSLVNFESDRGPGIVLCAHEEIAVGVAHGYARVTDTPLCVALHDVVGLLHGSMAIYNAWCDRVPMIIIGGTGPINSRARRPHIDWVHTALVQGNAVRDYVKWDDQPASIESIPESLLKAYKVAMTEPKGPVYLSLDVELQEQALTTQVDLPDASRFGPPLPVGPNPTAIDQAASLLINATWPVILADDIREPAALNALDELAELLAVPVVSVGSRFALPSLHPMNLTLARREALADADVLVAADVFDLEAALADNRRESPTGRYATQRDPTIVSIGMDDFLEHSWTSDRGALFPVDLPMGGQTGVALPLLLQQCQEAVLRGEVNQDRVRERRVKVESLHSQSRERRISAANQRMNAIPISTDRVYADMWRAIKDRPWSVVHSGYGRASSSLWEFSTAEELAGGGGRGSGMGQGATAALGGALALRDSGRLCVSLIGDGEQMYAPSALWTAANLQLPLLTVVCNNRSYGNDESHQDHMARQRNRPEENRGVGLYLEEPNVDFVSMAKTYGVEGFGPVEDPSELPSILKRAVATVADEHRPALVEVLTQRI